MLTFPNLIPAFSEQVKIGVVSIHVVSRKSLGDLVKKTMEGIKPKMPSRFLANMSDEQLMKMLGKNGL